jgi:hypothetical protein
LLAGCARVLGLDDIHPHDAAVDAQVCTTSVSPGDFSVLTKVFVGSVAPSLTSDQMLMYVVTSNVLAYSTYAGGWKAPMTVPSLDDPTMSEDRPSLSYDGQQMFFVRFPPGNYELPYLATRIPGAGESWNVDAVTFPGVLAGGDVSFGVPTADGNRVMVSHGSSQHELLAELAWERGAWQVIETTDALYPPGTDVSDTTPQLSPDGCWLVFTRLDHASPGNHDVWFAVRGLDGTFAPPQKLFTNVSIQDEQHPWLSPDTMTLYYFNGMDNTTYIAKRK